MLKVAPHLLVTLEFHEQDLIRPQGRRQVAAMAVMVEMPTEAALSTVLEISRMDHEVGHLSDPAMAKAGTNSTEAAHMGLQGNPL